MPLILTSAFFLTLLGFALFIEKTSQTSPFPKRKEKTAPLKGSGALSASEILGMEFTYARMSASEAMRDRHTMINYYLIIYGIVTSGVLLIIEQSNIPLFLGTVLLWLLSIIGYLYLLTLVRLRQAWHDSARTMNQIKSFYIEHAEGFEPEALKEAFRWRMETLPPVHQKWNVFYYSACLIGMLNAIAYGGGGMLFAQSHQGFIASLDTIVTSLLTLFFFWFHPWLYTRMLRSD